MWWSFSGQFLPDYQANFVCKKWVAKTRKRNLKVHTSLTPKTYSLFTAEATHLNTSWHNFGLNSWHSLPIKRCKLAMINNPFESFPLQTLLLSNPVCDICRQADYISCYPLPSLIANLNNLTKVLVWLTQVWVCKSAVCICRTPLVTWHIASHACLSGNLWWKEASYSPTAHFTSPALSDSHFIMPWNGIVFHECFF